MRAFALFRGNSKLPFTNDYPFLQIQYLRAISRNKKISLLTNFHNYVTQMSPRNVTYGIPLIHPVYLLY